MEGVEVDVGAGPGVVDVGVVVGADVVDVGVVVAATSDGSGVKDKVRDAPATDEG